MELAAYVGKRVFLKRGTGIAALLRAVMHQAVLANVEVARSGAAAPLIRTPQRDVVLKRIHAGKAAFLQSLHLVVHAAFFVVQGLQLARAVVNDSYGGTESQFQRASADGERILGMANAAAHH